MFRASIRPSSGVHKTVVAACGTEHTIWGWTFFRRPYLVMFEEACSPDSMICTRGCNYSFYVLLMLGAMDARNMLSKLVVNKYLHSVESCWISATNYYILWVCVCNLNYPAWKRKYHIILSSVACPAVKYCSMLSRKQHDFLKNITEHLMCVLIYSTFLSEMFLILRKIQRDFIINVETSSCKAPIILVRFWWH